MLLSSDKQGGGLPVWDLLRELVAAQWPGQGRQQVSGWVRVCEEASGGRRVFTPALGKISDQAAAAPGEAGLRPGPGPGPGAGGDTEPDPAAVLV